MAGEILFERVTQMLSAEPELRNEDDLTMILNWFKDLSRAEAKKGKVCVLGELADNALRELVKHSVLETHSRGQLLIKQGNTGDFMYIVLIGECEIRVSSGENSLREGDVIQGGGKEFGDALGVLVGTVGPGAVIGEVALVRNVLRTANVIVSASTDGCTVIRISRELYQRTLESHLEMLEREREQFANSFHLVSNLNPKLRQQFIRALMKEKYFNQDIIVKQGDKIEDVYFIVSGEVILYLNPNKLIKQYELHLQAKNVYSVLPMPDKPAGPAHRSHNARGRDSRQVPWSCVSCNGMLGDFEVLAQLPSRMTTAVALTETVLFRMNLLEFRRLVVKEGRETAKVARQMAKTTLHFRNSKRREKLSQKDLQHSEVAFVDYIVRAIDMLALPT